MSNFFDAMTSNDAFTANGAVTHSTSSDACLDLFFLVGASRGQDITNLVSKAFSEDFELTTRIMLWSRDVRQGAGERQHIKNFIKYLEDVNQIALATKVIRRLPELGRWDDMLGVTTPALQQVVANLVYRAIWLDKDALCAKWMPREKSAKAHVAKWLMETLSISPKVYRKALANATKVVETNLCNKDYTFNYAHVPSQAMKKYVKAFYRNDEARFEAYKQALVKGDTKINAGAVFPNEVLGLAREDDKLAVQMWKAMPNFLAGSEGSILPVCDVSGSMGTYTWSATNTPIMVSMGLGLYLAQRNTGPFKDMLMTFCGKPTMCKVPSLEATQSLMNTCEHIYKSAPDMSTNIQAVFDLLLKQLVTGKVSVEEMPRTLLIISDMEFNVVTGSYWSGNSNTNFEVIKQKYTSAGFPMPQLVFWNVNGRSGNVPVKRDESGTALVSGYSPSIVKSVLGNVIDPMSIMMKTVMADRYELGSI